eukprot:scaffold24003_cov90-Isochrysis_galbana.AAC.2
MAELGSTLRNASAPKGANEIQQEWLENGRGRRRAGWPTAEKETASGAVTKRSSCELTPL